MEHFSFYITTQSCKTIKVNKIYSKTFLKQFNVFLKPGLCWRHNPDIYFFRGFYLFKAQKGSLSLITKQKNPGYFTRDFQII